MTDDLETRIDADVPDYVLEGIYLLRTEQGPIYMLTERATEWLMTGDNCANRKFNAWMREQRDGKGAG